MHYGQLALASVAAFVSYFAVGTAFFFLMPQMMEEGRKHESLFRSREGQMAGMPVIMLATFVAILALTVLFAMGYGGGHGFAYGLHFGVLIAIFVVCAFVLHNYVNMQISRRLMLMQAVAHFVQWTVVGTVIGLLYRG